MAKLYDIEESPRNPSKIMVSLLQYCSGEFPLKKRGTNLEKWQQGDARMQALLNYDDIEHCGATTIQNCGIAATAATMLEKPAVLYERGSACLG